MGVLLMVTEPTGVSHGGPVLAQCRLSLLVASIHYEIEETVAESENLSNFIILWQSLMAGVFGSLHRLRWNITDGQIHSLHTRLTTISTHCSPAIHIISSCFTHKYQS